MPSAEEISQQQARLQIHRRNVQHYLQQYRQLGSAYVPPGVVNGLFEDRAEILRIKRMLRTWGMAVKDHPDDEPDPSAPAGSVTETLPARLASDARPNISVTHQNGGNDSTIVSNIGGDVRIGERQTFPVKSILFFSSILIVLLIMLWYIGYISLTP